MADRLSLSIWLERHSRADRVRYFEKLLRLFPFSQRAQPQSVLSIHAIDSTEPSLLEQPVNGPVDIDVLKPVFAEYEGDDIAISLETWWDLWQFEDDWTLAPARVELSCFGPNYDNGADRPEAEQEDLRIDFGLDSHYLPQIDVPGSAKLIESNIRSLLRLVHELDAALPVWKRRLETESGENFADRLERVLRTGA